MLLCAVTCISCGSEVIARHPRSYDREDFVFEPLHYLGLIEQKINALDQAAPLVDIRDALIELASELEQEASACGGKTGQERGL